MSVYINMWPAAVFVSLYLLLTVIIGITLTLTLGLVHLVLVPLLFKYSKTFQQQLVFLNYVQWPIHSNFSMPSERGVEGGRNLYIRHKSVVSARTIRIGIWHVLPRGVYERWEGQVDVCDPDQVNQLFDRELAYSGRPIILYCHGNANHRAAHHRVKLYQVLQNMDLHVVAFDYRGYGDSSFVLPMEAGVVEDALAVYDWLRSVIDRNDAPPPVYVWGHSLGSGIASHLLGNLNELSSDTLGRCLSPPDGLILESPFNNLRDEVDAHFMTVMVRWLPYFETTFVRPFSGYKKYEFKSDWHLSRVKSLPVLILHAKDDYVVPFRLGVRLHKAIEASRRAGGASVMFHAYDKSLGLGHTWICLAGDLPRVLSDFMATQSRKNAS